MIYKYINEFHSCSLNKIESIRAKLKEQPFKIIFEEKTLNRSTKEYHVNRNKEKFVFFLHRPTNYTTGITDY